MEKLFSKSHEWVKIEGSKAQIGLSDYAQQELGDIVYVNLPELGSDARLLPTSSRSRRSARF